MGERLPLHDVHVAAGAKMATICGWELPESYGDATAEYRAVRSAVGLIDRGDSGLVEVTGRDRAAFLHAMLTNDVKALAPGQGCAAALLDAHGKVQVIVALWVLDDRILIVTPPAMAATLIEKLDAYLFSEKAYLRDATGELALLVLAGPRAADVAERLTGVAAREPAWAHATGKVGEGEVRVVTGAGDTGEREVWLALPASAGADAWRAALAAGARPVGLVARESLRIEAGTPLPGHDVDGSVLLPELPGFERLVSYTKGCYLGQEVVVRIRDRGHVNRLFRGLVLEGATVPPAGAVVDAGGREAGRVSSATWSLGLERPLALALLRREHEPGARVTVHAGDTPVAATVSTLPFAR